MGRHYFGKLVSDQPWYRPGMDNPIYFWNPTFNPEAMIFYTGDKFPRLKNALLVAGATKRIARMVINGDFIVQSDLMLRELNVRFRDIAQGPDGYIYVLTEGRLRGPNDTDGMLLRLEPVAGGPAPASPGRAGASPD
jgi:glucose/arabinose dehydrogenase